MLPSSNGAKAGTLSACARAACTHVIEVFDQRGIAERFVSEGQVIRRAPFAAMILDISDLPIRYNYYLALRQTHIERILCDWVSELEVPIYRGREVTGFAQDDGRDGHCCGRCVDSA